MSFHVRALAFMALVSMFVPWSSAAIVTRPILKDFFQTGDIPTGQDFKDLIDSALNLTDDGLIIYRVGADSSGRALRFEAGATIDGSLTYLPTTLNAELAPNWAGLFGFLPLELLDATNASHYGYLQMQMASGPLPPPPGSPGPVIHVDYLVFDSVANTPLITAVTTPEVTSALVWCAGGGTIGLLRRRRRAAAGSITL